VLLVGLGADWILYLGEETRMDATEMFLIRHKRMHSHVERLTEGLSEEQIREGVRGS
jgi:hypothetical protein